MKWYKVKACLAVDGSCEVNRECGYVFQLPLDNNMRLLEDDWKQNDRPYIVTRFWQGEDEVHGVLVLHMRNSWLIKYGFPLSSDPTVQLGEETMRVGEYLSIRDHSDEMHSFLITSIDEIRWFPTASMSVA